MRLLHTADLQLGMTRKVLSGEAQARFTQDRIDVLRRIAAIVSRESCDLVVLCGDVFESNQVSRSVVARALEAFAEIPVPVYALPGNHDPLDAATLWHARSFLERRPHQLHVIEHDMPIEVAPGVELVGFPWRSKRPADDLVAAGVARLAPAARGVTRIGVGHGGLDTLPSRETDARPVSLAAAEAALAEGRLHYLALGDRHSKTCVGSSGRVWYPGAPEPTDFREVDAGHVLVADVTPERVHVTAHAVGTWRFVERERVDLLGAEDVAAFAHWLAAQPAKERTVLRVALHGALALDDLASVRQALEGAGALFAALDVDDASLLARPGDAELQSLPLTGFARVALERLRADGAGAGPEAATARDALALLVELARTDA